MSKRNAQPTSPTRKQVARSRREREQLRLIYIGLGTVAALILIVLAYGLYQTFVVEPNVPVATVNGIAITTGAYQDRVKYERFLLDEQIQQVQAQQQAALAQTEDQQLVNFLASQYQQLANQLLQQRSIVDRQTVNTMIDDKLVETEAAKRGLTVSDDEITEYINRFVAGRLGGLTAQAASATSTARVEASATAAQWTPTPTFTPSPTITATGAISPTPTLANTPTPAPTPTLNVIGPEALSTEYTNWLNIVRENTGLSEATYRQIIRTVVLRDKLREALAEEVPTSAEQAHARHILVETEAEAQAVIERLKAGEDFADLAAELSIDPGSAAEGGDLGFVPRGAFVEPVNGAVFSLPIGEISEPLQSQFGWHVVEVLEQEVRELSPLDYQRVQRLALSDWLDEARIEANIQDFWTVDKAPPDNLLAR
jgi:parvulin-like peptidyl-prolyl isomerase